MANRPLVLLLLFSFVAVHACAQNAPGAAASHDIEVTFDADEVRLAGTLLIPDSAQPAAAVIFVHGSGPGMPRSAMRPFADRFVRDGIAVLMFDKEGIGGSGGDWTSRSLDNLADDLSAAAAFLKTRKEIEHGRIGLWGVSQAGWVIPHAIARNPNTFAFAIVVTGGGVKPVDIERYDFDAELSYQQTTKKDRAEAMALVDRYFDYLRTGEERATLESAIASSANKPWASALNLGRVLPSAAAQPKWSWVATYDPALDIEHITVPVLVLLGGQDRPELTSKAQKQWQASLAKANNHDATVMVFVSAGHGITVGGHHSDGGGNHFALGYLDIVDAWLRAHTAP